MHQELNGQRGQIYNRDAMLRIPIPFILQQILEKRKASQQKKCIIGDIERKFYDPPPPYTPPPYSLVDRRKRIKIRIQTKIHKPFCVLRNNDNNISL